MSDKPLIIKCKFFNKKPDELEQIRRAIQKQMEEATPVVMLPCGFELAEVNVELLEKIKEEMDNKGWYNRHDKEQFAEIIDKHISELKGE